MPIQIKKHLWYYIPYVTFQVIMLYLGSITLYDKGIFMIVVLFSTSLSMIWALLHHYLHHDISTKIVLEYVLIGSLGITAAFFVSQTL